MNSPVSLNYKILTDLPKDTMTLEVKAVIIKYGKFEPENRPEIS